MPSVNARFHWTADDLLAGRKYATNSRKIWWIFILVMAAAFFAPEIFREKQLAHRHSLAAGLAVSAIFLVTIGVALPLGKMIGAAIVRRQFAKRPDANQEIEWEISETGITISASNAMTEAKWSAFQMIIFTPAGFLFMSNSQIFHIIPTRAFATPMDIENLKTLARQHATLFKEVS